MPKNFSEIKDRWFLSPPVLCHWCKKELVRSSKSKRAGNLCTVDHFIPQSEGGTGVQENLVPACPRCNNDRSNAQDRFKHNRTFQGNGRPLPPPDEGAK